MYRTPRVPDDSIVLLRTSHTLCTSCTPHAPVTLTYSASGAYSYILHIRRRASAYSQTLPRTSRNPHFPYHSAPLRTVPPPRLLSPEGGIIIRRYEVTKIRRYEDTTIRRYDDTKIRRYEDTKIGTLISRTGNHPGNASIPAGKLKKAESAERARKPLCIAVEMEWNSAKYQKSCSFSLGNKAQNDREFHSQLFELLSSESEGSRGPRIHGNVIGKFPVRGAYRELFV